jgi:hypothetical protein
MPFRHNKKRNVGLLSEFFARYIAKALLEKRFDDIEKAKSVWNKFVNPKTEIYKEFSYFNSLQNSSLKNREIAFNLLETVKHKTKKQNQKKLDEEKSRFIDEINNQLKDKEFFDREVPSYKDFASIQILLNAWRGIGFKGSLNEMVELEDSVLGILLTEKKEDKQLQDSPLDMTTEEVDGLVLKIMTEKANVKFAKVFNKEQQRIVQLYLFSENNSSTQQELFALLENIRRDSQEKINKTVNSSKELDKQTCEKLNSILSLIQENKKQDITDESVMFHMNLAKLKEELST